jgi:GNAT superfamily N-acetyltransferase
MADFRIDTYDRNHLEGMVALFNAETAFEPHIAPLTRERFIELVERKSSFDPEGLFVAVEAGEVVGWTHACVAAGSEPWQDPGNRVPRIRMLIYPKERLPVGRALVAEATEWLRQTGQPEFEAMHAKVGYPFYRGLWLGGEPMCPATLPHLQLAFEVAGYKNTQESVFMVAEMPARAREHRPLLDIDLAESAAEMKHEPMRESWIGFQPMVIRALLDGEEVGSICWVLLPHVADRLGAPCMNIWAMGVREERRRMGIASALVSRAMALSHDLGARFASVGTQLWNSPAHATYAKFGFRPYCVLVGRTLEVSRSERTPDP